MAKQGLGRGLDALIPTKKILEEEKIEISENGQDTVHRLPVGKIRANRWQPRLDFDEDSIERLSESLKESGILQPIVVQKSDGGFELIAGERRLRAAKLAGWETIPAIITDATEQQRLQLSIIENIQRENLNAMEEALAYQNLIHMADCTQEELASLVGKERSTVANSLRLLKLPPEIQSYVRQGEISPGHARSILALNNPKEQFELCDLIIKKGLSVRQSEEYIKNKQGGKTKNSSKETSKDAVLLSLQDRLTRKFATKVKIAHQNRTNKGKIIIEYYSSQDLDRIIQSLE